MNKEQIISFLNNTNFPNFPNSLNLVLIVDSDQDAKQILDAIKDAGFLAYLRYVGFKTEILVIGQR